MKRKSEEKFNFNALVACLAVSMCANFYGFVIMPEIERGDADTILMQELDPAYFEGDRILEYIIPEAKEPLNIVITPAPQPTPTPKVSSNKSNLPSIQYEGATVYVTKSGSKFLRETCSSLSKSKIPLLYEDATEKGYTPCGKCKP